MFTNVFTFSEGVMSERYQNKMMNEIKALLKYKRKYLRQIRKKKFRKSLLQKRIFRKNIFNPSVNAGLGKNPKQHWHSAHPSLPTLQLFKKLKILTPKIGKE